MLEHVLRLLGVLAEAQAAEHGAEGAGVPAAGGRAGQGGQVGPPGGRGRLLLQRPGRQQGGKAFPGGLSGMMETRNRCL